jgi:hypothetical protein
LRIDGGEFLLRAMVHVVVHRSASFACWCGDFLSVNTSVVAACAWFAVRRW